MKYLVILCLLLCGFCASRSEAALVLEGDTTVPGAPEFTKFYQPTFTGADRIWVVVMAREASDGFLYDSVSFGYRGDQGTEAGRNGTTVSCAATVQTASSGLMIALGMAYIGESDIAARNSDTIRFWGTGSSGGTKMFGYSVVWSDVKQTGFAVDSVTNSTTSSSPNPLTQTITYGGVSVIIAAYAQGNDGAYSWNNSFTETSDESFNGAAMSTGYKIESSGSSETISANATNQNRQALVGISFDEEVDGEPAVDISYVRRIKEGEGK